MEPVDAGVDRLPVPVEGADGAGELELSPGQRAAFLEYIKADPKCSVRDACLAAGVKRHLVRRLRREDPEFEEDYQSARGSGQHHIMFAMREEAIEGKLVPVVSAGKQVVDKNGEPMFERRRSEKLLEALYKTGTREGAPLLGPKVGLEISGEVKHTVQRGVTMEDVAKELAAAGIDLAALAAGDEDVVDDAAEIVDETDD